MKVEARNPLYCGMRAGVRFNNGVAYTDDEAALRTLERSGFTVTSEDDEDQRVREASRPASVDPQRVRQPNRDAAVHPREADNGIPVNAGQGDPHSVKMAQPGIHDAVGGRGQVRMATSAPEQRQHEGRPRRGERQRRREVAESGPKPPLDPTTVEVDSDLEGQEVADPVDADDPSAQDPAATTVEPVEPAEGAAVRPNDSANKGEWVEYAKASGYDESEGLTKDELVERYG